MFNEKLLEALNRYQRREGKNPDIIKVHPTYYNNVLKELNYPEWLIQKKEMEQKKSLFGVKAIFTNDIETFEL
ncbi:hypothetical protein LW858_29825 (plasmid) [Bacillus cereus]|uniref:Uncharacterized protein n=1 Tax=Bacillus cereus TaxID=1396 RepID=A0A9X6B5F5_BACCE|nr:hypothetical protein [Bacillus cereus]OOR72485.1 hypothetical protein BLX06_24585 [Bacillus cereus]UIJ69742.1 hypothetical protein LW858_29825 [Bacillus cereus]